MNPMSRALACAVEHIHEDEECGIASHLGVVLIVWLTAPSRDRILRDTDFVAAARNLAVAVDSRIQSCTVAWSHSSTSAVAEDIAVSTVAAAHTAAAGQAVVHRLR